MDFTSTTKIIFSDFFPEQAACLHDQINCFTLHIFLYKYFAVKYKLCRPNGPLSLSSSAIVAANREITKVVDSEKEETMKNCSLACGQITLCAGRYRFQLILKAITPCMEEIWLVSHSQPFFLRTARPRHTKVRSLQEKGTDYARLRSSWPHETRRIACS